MFRWSEKYITGYQSIDEQHEGLFSVINSVEKMFARVTEISSDKINDVFEELLHYTIYHFSTEEEFWVAYDQDLYKHQKKEHGYFISQLETFDVSLIESNGQACVDELMVRLSDWIVNHVETEIIEIKTLLNTSSKG